MRACGRAGVQRKATVFEGRIDRELIAAQFRERSDLLR
jgi:hypothetical protein